MDYPVWDLAMGGRLLMALVAIPHVIVSHSAVGGGLLIDVTETLVVIRDDPELRELACRSWLVLALVSTVAFMVRRVLTSPASGPDAA